MAGKRLDSHLPDDTLQQLFAQLQPMLLIGQRLGLKGGNLLLIDGGGSRSGEGPADETERVE